MYGLIDKDQDGGISRAEFLEFVAHKMEKMDGDKFDATMQHMLLHS